jgi:predicted lipoprotein with Yx(FWY)xxD motif
MFWSARAEPGEERITRLRAVVACAACVCLAAFLAACGSAQAGQASPPAWQVRAGQVRGLGTILTDGRGFTLYMYQPDHRGPSVCSGLCAAEWPPLVLPRGVSRPVAGPGVNPALLGTAPRAGGVLQVTYNRWPLYLWQDDTAPGQATGQAEGMGAWYTMAVSGSIDRLPLP